MIQLIKTLNQTCYFLLELAMLGFWGMAGFQSVGAVFWKYALAIGFPLIIAVLWGYFAAPRSTHRLPLPYRAMFALVLFGLTALVLYRLDHPRLAITFGALAFLCQSLEVAFHP